MADAAQQAVPDVALGTAATRLAFAPPPTPPRAEAGRWRPRSSAAADALGAPPHAHAAVPACRHAACAARNAAQQPLFAPWAAYVQRAAACPPDDDLLEAAALLAAVAGAAASQARQARQPRATRGRRPRCAVRARSADSSTRGGGGGDGGGDAAASQPQRKRRLWQRLGDDAV